MLKSTADRLRLNAEFYGMDLTSYVTSILGFLEKDSLHLGEASRDDLLRALLLKDGEIAALKFQNYDLYSDNRVLLMRLSGCEATNRMLYEKLKKEDKANVDPTDAGSGNDKYFSKYLNK